MSRVSGISLLRSMKDALRTWTFVGSLSFLALGVVACNASLGADKSKAGKADADADSEEEDLSGLVVPAELLGKTKESDRQKFSQELRGLLLEGFKEKDGLNAAKKRFETARRLVADDPRAGYAYGVVLVSQNRSNVALDQFRSAAKHKGIAYLPAMQAIAWVSVSRNEHAPALTALRDLATELEESQESFPGAEDKERSAEWLGRMVGFLNGPAKTTDQAAAIDKLTAEVSKLLKSERQEAFERGRKQAANRFSELQAVAALPEAELAAEVKRQKEEIAAASTAADREVKQLEGELRDLKKPLDKQLADLSHEIHDDSLKIKTSSSRLIVAEKEVEELSSPKKHASNKMQSNNRRTGVTTKVVIREENAGEKKIRESQLASAEKTRDNLQSAIEEAKQGIETAKQQRNDLQVEFRKATAEKRKTLLAAQHKAADLAARARDAKNGGLTPESLKARVKELDAYVPFHPDVEKTRLLATLKPAT